MILLLLGLLAAPAPPSETPAQIQAAIGACWAEGSPVRNLRTKCRITLKVEQMDPALGDDAFPNYGDSPASLKPQTLWDEEIGRRAGKHYAKYRFETPEPDAPTPRDLINFSNGRTSYKYEPSQFQAYKFAGQSAYTDAVQNYYGDMVGFPGKTITPPIRLTVGVLAEPFELDLLVPSGHYRAAGDEVVGGEDCVVLERPGLDRLWLAKDKGHAIVRRDWQWTVGGPLKRRIQNTDFRPVAGGAWLPHLATMEIYGRPDTRPGRRVGLLRAEVVEIEPDVPDSLFEPHFPFYILVNDNTGGTRSFAGADDLPLDETTKRLKDLPQMFRPVAWWERPTPG